MKKISSTVIALFMILAGCSEDSVAPVLETDTVTDINGNLYETVKIGNQWWMTQNLKVTKYRNGETISQASTANNWKSANAAYCVYNNSAAAPGLLYNWYAVNDPRNIAPEGWHVPTDEDWAVLEQTLGMSPRRNR